MSIKRTREVRRPRRDTGGDDSPLTRPSGRTWDWEKDVASRPDDAFTPYVTSGRFSTETLLLHPTFGKGVVVSAEAQKIEVLFEDGPKKLVHGRTA